MWTFSGGDKKGDRPKLKGETDEIVTHMKQLRRKSGVKPPKELKNKKAASTFGKSYAGVLGIFEQASGREFEAFAALEKLQGHRGHVKFAYTTSAEVATMHDVTAPAIVLVKKYDNGKDVAPDNILSDATSMAEWVQSHSTETVCDLGEEKKTDCGHAHPMTIFIGAAKHKEEKKAFAAAAKKMRESGKEMNFGRMSKSHKAVKVLSSTTLFVSLFMFLGHGHVAFRCMYG
jgi:hypothetical protein